MIKEDRQKSLKIANEIEQGKEWEKDVVHHIKKQRNLAYIGFLAMLVANLGLSTSVTVMAPLKTVEPLFIEVERSTGQIHVKTDLINEISDVSEKNAVIEAMLAKYLVSWKTYEYTDNLERQKFIQAMSSSDVYREYLSIWSSDDPEVNPKLRYGLQDKAEVEILSIVELNKTTHQARIAVKDKKANRSEPTVNYFVVILRHKIAPIGMSQQDRWKNPIGILVDSVRFDEEYID